MKLIPVLDIRQGLVVRAVAGDRAAYRPIETALAPGTSAPLDVARGFLRLWSGFRHLYIADLDGIEQGERTAGRQIAREILASFPGLTILIDDGAATPDHVADLASEPRLVPVIGSETLRRSSDLGAIALALGGRCALSLDWRGHVPLGPAEAFADASLWPQTVIAMTLTRVGGTDGPDLARVSDIAECAGGRLVLAAGGVRRASDIEALSRAGAGGALVASALHDGRLTADDLARLAS